MKHIIIKSDGEMPQESFSLMGVSTKRDDDETIGQFGTGLKYGIAGLLRSKVGFYIVSNKKKFKFRTKEIQVKGKIFNQIQFRKGNTKWIDLGYSSEMGLLWNLDGSLREIVSNAMDESGFEYYISEKKTFDKGYTYFVIDYTPEVKQYFDKFDVNFLHNRTPIWSSYGLAIYLRIDNNGTRVYRKGVLVYESSEYGLWDYEVSVDVQENRKATSSDVECEITKLFNCLPDEYKSQLLKHIKKSGKVFEEKVRTWINDVSWQRIIENKYILATAMELAVVGDFLIGFPVLELPNDWVEWQRRNGCGRSISDVLGKDKIKNYKSYEPNKLENEMFIEAKTFIETSGFDLSKSLFKFFKNLENEPFGEADLKTNEIWIFEKAFTEGKRDMVDTILHEYYHLKSGCSDRTMRFERFLINEIVKLLEINSGKLL